MWDKLTCSHPRHKCRTRDIKEAQDPQPSKRTCKEKNKAYHNLPAALRLSWACTMHRQEPDIEHFHKPHLPPHSVLMDQFYSLDSAEHTQTYSTHPSAQSGHWRYIGR